MSTPAGRETEQPSRIEHTELPALPEHASPSSTGLPNDASQHPEDRAGAPPKRSWLRIVLVSLFLLLCGALVFYRLHTNKQAAQAQAGAARSAQNRPIPVAFNTVRQRNIPIYLTALGTVTAYNTVTVKSRVDGQITAVNFREGQKVKQGQLLLQIDPRPYQAALSQAQGTYEKDQANAAFAQAQAARYNQLYAAGVISKESTQTQESSAGQASGTLAADLAAIQAARVNLAYTHISSPITGVVGLRQVDIGNIVAANSSTGLVVITQVEPIAVIFTLPEDQLPQVFAQMKEGRKLTVEAWDRGDQARIASGQLLTVDNQIDTTTGTAKLKAVFDNHDGALFPNQFVNVRLILENRNALTIPAAALQTGTSSSFVYVIDMQHPVQPGQAGPGGAAAAGGSGGSGGGRHGGGAGGAAAGGAGGGAAGPRQTTYPVHTRPVNVALTQGTTVILNSGLQAGEQVVTDGQEKLKDGSLVIPHPAAQVDGPAASNGSNRPPDPERTVPAKKGHGQGTGGNRVGGEGGSGNGTGAANGTGATSGTDGTGAQQGQQGTTAGSPRQ